VKRSPTRNPAWDLGRWRYHDPATADLEEDLIIHARDEQTAVTHLARVLELSEDIVVSRLTLEAAP
jgi:hypothetical protein